MNLREVTLKRMNLQKYLCVHLDLGYSFDNSLHKVLPNRLPTAQAPHYTHSSLVGFESSLLVSISEGQSLGIYYLFLFYHIESFVSLDDIMNMFQ